MGWSTGSVLMEDIVTSFNEKFPDDPELRKQIYLTLIPEFENYDCDTLCEIDDEVFVEAFKEINPDSDDEWEDWDDGWGEDEET